MPKLNEEYVVFTEPYERQTGDAWFLDLQAFLTDPGVRLMHPAEVGIIVRAIVAHISGAQNFDEYVSVNCERYGVQGIPMAESLWVEDGEEVTK